MDRIENHWNNYLFIWIFSKLEAIRGHQSPQTIIMCWPMNSTSSGIHKNIYHLWFSLHHISGLHWRSTWPLMNPPNNIPFWGPQAMCNPYLKKNLKKSLKKTHFWGFEAVRGFIPMMSQSMLKAFDLCKKTSYQ